MVLAKKKKEQTTDQWNRIESPEPIFCDKRSKNT